MTGKTTAPFLRVGNHLINLASIHQVTLADDGSATLLLHGLRKGLQVLKVNAPAGRELWNFVYNQLSVVEFDLSSESQMEEVADDAEPVRAPKRKKGEKKGRG